MPARVLSHPAWPSVLAVVVYALVSDALAERPCHQASHPLVAAAVAVLLANVLGTAVLARRRHPRPRQWLSRTALAGVLTGCAVGVLWLGASFEACFVF